MALNTTYAPVREAGNGVKIDFDFDFEVISASDLSVGKILKSTDVKTDMVLGVDYTVALDTVTRTGTVTYTVAPTTLQDSWIGRAVAITQPTDIPTNNIFREVQVENALDRQAMISQQIQEEVDRCVKLPDVSSGYTPVLPVPEDGRTPSWSGTSGAMVNIDVSPASIAAAVAAAEAAQTAAELAETNAETAETNAETAETNAEAAQAAAEAAAAAIDVRYHTQTFDADDLSAKVLTLTHPTSYSKIKHYLIFDNNNDQIGNPDSFDMTTLAMDMTSFVDAGILTSGTTWTIQSVWGADA